MKSEAIKGIGRKLKRRQGKGTLSLGCLSLRVRPVGHGPICAGAVDSKKEQGEK